MVIIRYHFLRRFLAPVSFQAPIYFFIGIERVLFFDIERLVKNIGERHEILQVHYSLEKIHAIDVGQHFREYNRLPVCIRVAHLVIKDRSGRDNIKFIISCSPRVIKKTC
ncbi:hypothetical protein ES705_45201 [subsurface metagenome]